MSATASHSPPGPAGTLLVVDDERTILELFGMILEAEGYRCHLLNNGAEGLEFFRQHQTEIDGIVTDFHMPVLDGLGLIRAVREFDSSVRILLCSGSLNQGDPRIPAGLRVSGFLPKPFSPEDLVRSVQEMIRSAH